MDALELLRQSMLRPLEAVLDQRGGLPAIVHQSSGGERLHLGLGVELKGASFSGSYGFEILPLQEG